MGSSRELILLLYMRQTASCCLKKILIARWDCQKNPYDVVFGIIYNDRPYQTHSESQCKLHLSENLGLYFENKENMLGCTHIWKMTAKGSKNAFLHVEMKYLAYNEYCKGASTLTQFLLIGIIQRCQTTKIE